jgi:hypothetical protein
MEKFKKINIDGDEYNVEELSESALLNLNLHRFTTQRIEELDKTTALLQKAKNGYLDFIKNEVIADKAGFLFGSE